jgi:hypothetical protein
VNLSPLQQRALQVAKRYLGQHEATGHNDGALPRLAQRFIANGAAWLDRQPWCACFAVFCVHTAAREIGLTSALPKTASSSALYRWFRDHGRLLDQPVPGCVGLVKGGPTGHQHTFLVHDVRHEADGLMVVIGVDGNYKNAVSWSKRPASACHYGPIC